MKIPLARPEIDETDREAVLEVLSTPFLSLGPKINEFEEAVSRYVGTKYAVAVNSGTSGLHLSVRASGIGKGDEVITTPFSFIASANCIIYEQAKPVFVDIDPQTLNIDEGLIEEKITERTKAILPVHVFGIPCRMDAIQHIAKRHNLIVIEDACEAIGAAYKNKKVGTFGLAGVFAFYPNKQITTGEGGIVVTNNQKMADLMKSLRNQGRSPAGKWLAHERIGFNYRLSDIHAALGVSQMSRIEKILEKRKRVASYYMRHLANIEEIELPPTPPETEVSWFVFVIRLRPRLKKSHRDRIMHLLQKKGIECGNYFPPIHLQPFYRKMYGFRKGSFPVAESVAERTIALPFYNYLSEEDIRYVCDSLKEALVSINS
ncbi:MAG TPA: DegT/DnrJ/EryC1/StrS family aminotransferase [Syntrophales bacterium]|nr:DegT/DnrJ/EryC1/StrS family aminotransferase [Syntrophales bacterium]HOL60160.1 DegT/DnrJ/EryC1/StrS family aminotransferase [Syntrophales bacterium]HPO36271.1 DegT/DnrJ/EryC1/StrS family aminotransferase [Syntrophales bacterium]